MLGTLQAIWDPQAEGMFSRHSKVRDCLSCHLPTHSPDSWHQSGLIRPDYRLRALVEQSYPFRSHRLKAQVYMCGILKHTLGRQSWGK